MSTRDSHDRYLSLVQLPSQISYPSKHTTLENRYTDGTNSTLSPRSLHKGVIFALRLSPFLMAVATVVGFLWWTILISISTSSRIVVSHSYLELYDHVVSDWWDIGDIAVGSIKSRELDFCPEEFENQVPCYNATKIVADDSSDVAVIDRDCGSTGKEHCLVIPPVDYKIPLRWPSGRDTIWVANVKITAQQVLSSGSLTKRMMILEEEQISFRSASIIFDGVEDYAQQIAKMVGLSDEDELRQAGVRTILDIGCGYGSFGAHLFSKQLLTMCIADYEAHGSQVQLTLERGLPAVISTFTSNQLPYPSLSFDMLHCLRCGIDWEMKDGKLLIEADRVLKPGGYFVWTSPIKNGQGSRNEGNMNRRKFIHDFGEGLCWELLSQQDETVVWKKTSEASCYSSRTSGMTLPICDEGVNVESPFYLPLQGCIAGANSRRWIPIEARKMWPVRAYPNATELQIYDLHSEVLNDDMGTWKFSVREYWSLLSPVIFSDHPKRPGDEDPLPPYNIVRNVLDMNARFGGFNAALLDEGKYVWVMNVVPTIAQNHLPLIFDRGLVGVLHDWCEPFPTYPRTYDLVHAAGFLSLQDSKHSSCSLLDTFTEIDRILRPEGWVIFRDTTPLIETARALATRLKWDARLVGVDNNTEERLLICQKPYLKRQLSNRQKIFKGKE
ncbi:hypothetical protein MLD38_034554 [Melastoma candidum]|uniref:Uncharacterized protein n=1 Tax=Melastoma candidum TaxID=119954 RepID=A0ACB9MA09_9MYRT|nr:hypothetical protein MLD38_034554 [Melastoma candidum]